LYILIFGKSLLNDGVAVVLFDSLIEHMGDSVVVDAASFSDTVSDFLVISTGSIFIGVVCGIATTLYFCLLHRKQKSDVTETASFFAWALIPYYNADGMQYSGTISIMVMGFIMDYYVIGGFQSEDNEWMEYMEMRCNSTGDVTQHVSNT
jgi:NhaP-type Na+/H+ or K+/H+ antiporter